MSGSEPVDGTPSATVSSGNELPPQMHPYLGHALDVVQQHALMSPAVDWIELRREAWSRSRDAVSPADCYPVIEWALGRLGDQHSFLEPPERGSVAIAAGTYADEATVPSARLTSTGVATIVVPGFRGSPSAVLGYAAMLRSLIDDLHADGAAGWVLDVAGNGGGNMLPMLAGLAPLLGTGTVGGFASADESVVWWTLDPGGALSIGDELVVPGQSRPTDPALATAPVALVSGPVTASSGEAVVVSLRGRANAKSFGAPTRGLATSNESFDLSDGATLVVTTAWMVDRRGAKYPAPIVPDVVVLNSDDRALTQAVRWASGAGQAQG